jgi:putative addiction module component (TIGR02574 family)
MSKADILAELPKLSPEDRSEIMGELWHLEEANSTGSTPTAAEKTLLDRELADYHGNPQAGAPWAEVAARLRRRS